MQNTKYVYHSHLEQGHRYLSLNIAIIIILSYNNKYLICSYLVINKKMY